MALSQSDIYRYIFVTAFAAALMLAAMLLVSVFNNGVTAQHFEWVNDVETYTGEIVAAETPLRLILTFDYFFLTFYTATFVFLAMAISGTSLIGFLSLLPWVLC